MKIKSSFYLTGIVGLSLIFFSCQKELDSLKSEEVIATPLPGQTTYCRIESIWQNPGAPDQQFRLIGYDEFENPKYITTPFVTTGRPFYTFKYDNWHRLKEYRGEYSNGEFEFWHSYGYDQSGRIGIDTMYVLGSPTSYRERRISTIHYDTQNRISRITTVSNFGPLPEQHFNYDPSGNLIYPPEFGITYDNKKHVNRTNDIWQFITRDYSVNNPFFAHEYNSTGFPTKINWPGNYGWVNGEFRLNQSQISYNCRPAYW